MTKDVAVLWALSVWLIDPATVDQCREYPKGRRLKKDSVGIKQCAVANNLGHPEADGGQVVTVQSGQFHQSDPGRLGRMGPALS